MLRQFPVVTTDQGVTRQVLSDSAELMMVAFRFEKDAEGKLHNHPHVQSTYVQSGRFVFALGEDSVEVGPGDSFVIPANLRHGCRCIEPGTLIDCFAPRRDDFL